MSSRDALNGPAQDSIRFLSLDPASSPTELLDEVLTSVPGTREQVRHRKAVETVAAYALAEGAAVDRLEAYPELFQRRFRSDPIGTLSLAITLSQAGYDLSAPFRPVRTAENTTPVGKWALEYALNELDDLERRGMTFGEELDAKLVDWARHLDTSAVAPLLIRRVALADHLATELGDDILVSIALAAIDQNRPKVLRAFHQRTGGKWMAQLISDLGLDVSDPDEWSFEWLEGCLPRILDRGLAGSDASDEEWSRVGNARKKLLLAAIMCCDDVGPSRLVVRMCESTFNFPIATKKFYEALLQRRNTPPADQIAEGVLRAYQALGSIWKQRVVSEDVYWAVRNTVNQAVDELLPLADAEVAEIFGETKLLTARLAGPESFDTAAKYGRPRQFQHAVAAGHCVDDWVSTQLQELGVKEDWIPRTAEALVERFSRLALYRGGSNMPPAKVNLLRAALWLGASPDDDCRLLVAAMAEGIHKTPEDSLKAITAFIDAGADLNHRIGGGPSAGALLWSTISAAKEKRVRGGAPFSEDFLSRLDELFERCVREGMRLTPDFAEQLGHDGALARRCVASGANVTETLAGALRHGNKAAAQWCSRRGADINGVAFGRPMLEHAAKGGLESWLVERGASAPPEEAKSVLQWWTEGAILRFSPFPESHFAEWDAETLQQFDDFLAERELSDQSLRTVAFDTGPMFQVPKRPFPKGKREARGRALNNARAYARKLIEFGLDPRRQDNFVSLCALGMEDIVVPLIDEGQDVNPTTRDQWSPLSAALMVDCWPIAKKLVEAGARLGAPEKQERLDFGQDERFPALAYVRTAESYAALRELVPLDSVSRKALLRFWPNHHPPVSVAIAAIRESGLTDFELELIQLSDQYTAGELKKILAARTNPAASIAVPAEYSDEVSAPEDIVLVSYTGKYHREFRVVRKDAFDQWDPPRDGADLTSSNYQEPFSGGSVESLSLSPDQLRRFFRVLGASIATTSLDGLPELPPVRGVESEGKAGNGTFGRVFILSYEVSGPDVVVTDAIFLERRDADAFQKRLVSERTVTFDHEGFGHTVKCTVSTKDVRSVPVSAQDLHTLDEVCQLRTRAFGTPAGFDALMA